MLTRPQCAARCLDRPQRSATDCQGTCRAGEITGLELDSVDFLRREVDVRQQLAIVVGRAPYLGPVKTKTSARTVELPDVVLTALARHAELRPPAEVEIDDETDPRRPVRARCTAAVHDGG